MIILCSTRRFWNSRYNQDPTEVDLAKVIEPKVAPPPFSLLFVFGMVGAAGERQWAAKGGQKEGKQQVDLSESQRNTNLLFED